MYANLRIKKLQMFADNIGLERDSPKTLYKLTVAQVANNLANYSSLCNNNDDCNFSKFERTSFKKVKEDDNDDDHHHQCYDAADKQKLPMQIVQDIWDNIEKHHQITDSMMMLNFFAGHINKLRSLVIHDASALSTIGFNILKQHPLVELVVWRLDCKQATIGTIVNSLSQWSLTNLETLSVRCCIFSGCPSISQALSLSQLVNLRTLDVSYTDFDNDGLDIVSQHLDRLTSLNISNTKVFKLKPLALCAKRLTQLWAKDVSCNCTDEADTLRCLRVLHLLDVSTATSVIGPGLQEIFAEFGEFEKLTDLDISGRTEITMSQIESFIQQKQNVDDKGCRLRCLGLHRLFSSISEYKHVQQLLGNQCKITGPPIDLETLIHSLGLYAKLGRTDFVLDILIALRQASSQPYIIGSTECLQVCRLLIDTLESFKHSPSVLLEAANCLLNIGHSIHHHDVPLCEVINIERLSPHTITKLVRLCIDLMQQHRNIYELQDKLLSVLYSYQILYMAHYDKVNLFTLTMEFNRSARDLQMKYRTLWIGNCLLKFATQHELATICDRFDYIIDLLQYFKVQPELDPGEIWQLMDFSTQIMSCLTECSAKVCELFVDNDGLQLLYGVVMRYPNNQNVMLKVVDILHNIANFAHLRKFLMHEKWICFLSLCMFKRVSLEPNDTALGILLKLWSDEHYTDWSLIPGFDANCVTCKLGIADYRQWPTLPADFKVQYNLLKPILPLLTCHTHVIVQMWTLLMIYHTYNHYAALDLHHYQELPHEESIQMVTKLLDHHASLAELGNVCYIEWMRNRLVKVSSIACFRSKFEKTLGYCGQPILEVITQFNDLFKYKLRHTTSGSMKLVDFIRLDRQRRCSGPPEITHIVMSQTDDANSVDMKLVARLILCDCALQNSFYTTPQVCLAALILQLHRLKLENFRPLPENLDSY